MHALKALWRQFKNIIFFRAWRPSPLSWSSCFLEEISCGIWRQWRFLEAMLLKSLGPIVALLWANSSLNAFLCKRAAIRAYTGRRVPSVVLSTDWTLLPAWKWLEIGFGIGSWKSSLGWLFWPVQLQPYPSALKGKYVTASAVHFKSTYTVL